MATNLRTLLARLFISLVVLCLGASCATVEAPSDRADREQEILAREVKDELMVGRQMAAKLLGKFSLYSGAPEATEYVKLVGHTLARQSGRPEIKFYFAILDTPEINAFATPGGYIFVTKGLLLNLRSEAELAAVLGHELAHVNEKHMYKMIAPKKQVSANESIARMLSRGNSDLGASISQVVNSGIKLLLEEGLGSEKEHAADEASTLYVLASGYPPGGMLSVVKKLAEQNGTEKLGKTHPPFPERIASLERFMKQNGLKFQIPPPQTQLAKRFKQSFAQVTTQQ
ncbi:M48 family metalloprotease [Bdellovibrionota bacterium FG-2]